jgi:undecaprenyl-phosphate galactose phosphotransferase
MSRGASIQREREERPPGSRAEVIPFPLTPVRARDTARRVADKAFQVSSFLLADALALISAFLAAHLIRTDILPHLFHRFDAAALTVADYARLSWLSLIYVVFFVKEGLYVRRRPFWVEVRHLYTAIFFATGFFLAALTLTRNAAHVSRATIGIMMAIMLITAPLARYLVKSLLFKCGPWRKRILILGATPTAELLAHNLGRDPFLGYEVTGFLDDDLPSGRPFGGLTVLGGVRELPRLLEQTRSSDVLVAISSLSRERLQSIIAMCEQCTESVRLVPDVLGFGLAGTEIEMVQQVPIISMNYNLRKPWNIALKVVLDRTLALLLLVLCSPLLVLTALLVALESRGPILFSQRRVGYGYGFQCYKFRTMYVDADERLQRWLSAHPEHQAEWEEFRKLRGFDPRVTRVGALLRRCSLDELPQLWNILRGDMSLVGPRPYMPNEIERMGPDPDRVLHTILITPPGLTGLWQVSGRSEVPFETRIRMDVHYVRNWSIWLDFVILWKTIWVVLARKGAY